MTRKAGNRRRCRWERSASQLHAGSSLSLRVLLFNVFSVRRRHLTRQNGKHARRSTNSEASVASAGPHTSQGSLPRCLHLSSLLCLRGLRASVCQLSQDAAARASRTQFHPCLLRLRATLHSHEVRATLPLHPRNTPTRSTFFSVEHRGTLHGIHAVLRIQSLNFATPSMVVSLNLTLG